MPVVRAIQLLGFRGAPLPFEVDFLNSKGDPRSALIIGDNGSGKSTIVDALEFALQARVGRLAGFNSDANPRIASYGRSGSPEVVVTLADGRTVTRSADVDEDGRIRVRDSTQHPQFRLAPVGIKRSDLLRFASTEATKRLVQLLDFFGQPEQDVEQQGVSVELGPLEEQRNLLKDRRRSEARSLSDLMGVSLDAVPLGQQFEEWIRRYGRPKGRRSRHKVRSELLPTVQRIRNLTDELKIVEKDIERATTQTRKRHLQQARLSPIQGVLESAGDALTDSFRAIASDSFVQAIQLRVADQTQVSLQMLVQLPNGAWCPPTRVLSEGKQDLLTLLLFVALAEQAAQLGQPRLLILDDALQSLSGRVRIRFAEYLVGRLRDWQLILTVHDRLWARQLRDVMIRMGHPVVEREIVDWSYQGGPVLGQTAGLPQRLQEATQDSDPVVICALAGRNLEELADHLSCEMRASVSRQRGDHYTLADTWPSVAKKLRKTSLADVVADIDRWQHLRNVVGAHHNDWAGSLSLGEAREFALAVLNLDRATRCANCGLAAGSTGPSILACACGQISVGS